MEGISSLSRISLYLLLVMMGIFSIFICIWQILVLHGKALKNSDGSHDDWHEQKSHYGIAFADVYVACPANFAGIILVFLSSRWGYYLLALASFWWVWANTMTTVNSLRFERPKITSIWLLTYPFGILVGLAYIVWSILYFDIIYFL